VFIYITQMSMTVSKSATGGAVQPATDKALFLAQSGELQLDVRVDSETVWLTQVQLAELFGIKVPAINEHLGNIYGTGELEREATIRKFRIVRQEGRRQVERDIAHYKSRCSDLGWLSRQFQDRHCFPPVGDQDAPRASNQRPPSAAT
jgi:hypothetical protein